MASFNFNDLLEALFLSVTQGLRLQCEFWRRDNPVSGRHLGWGEEGDSETVRRRGLWTRHEGLLLKRRGGEQSGEGQRQGSSRSKGCAWHLAISSWQSQHKGWRVTAGRTPIFTPRRIHTVCFTHCTQLIDPTISQEASEEEDAANRQGGGDVE